MAFCLLLMLELCTNIPRMGIPKKSINHIVYHCVYFDADAENKSKFFD